MEYNIWTELQDKDLESCKKFNNNLKSNYGICMFNLKLSGNIGMAVRSACTLGCNKFIICGRRQYDKRFTVGAHHYIDISFWDEPIKVTIKTISNNKYSEETEYFPSEFIKKCQIDNWTPVFIEQGGQDIRNSEWKKIEKPLLILGNESIGIPKSFINEVSRALPETRILSIPQWSILRSMNVTNAATIAMWELQRVNNYF